MRETRRRGGKRGKREKREKRGKREYLTFIIHHSSFFRILRFRASELQASQAPEASEYLTC
ncbi:MAG: hypothetical protein SWY16_17075 [Cyanobacteriota bacterium]|nr:hypothetical protein [Cyanobacteriota bacterium]